MSQPRYDTIDVAIRRALAGQGFEDKRYYVQAFINARRWYESEYLGGGEKAYGHRTALLRVEVDRTAELPADYVEWDMVGIKRGEVLVNLLHNPALVGLPDSLVESLTPALQKTGQPVGLDSFCYQYTNCLATIGVDTLTGYGFPYGKPGEFTVQRAERQLLVSSKISPGTVLYLHYLSDDAPMGEGTQVHPLAMAWMEFYVLGFLYEKINPTLSAKYEARAAGKRLDYLTEMAGLQTEDVYEAMRQSLTWLG